MSDASTSEVQTAALHKLIKKEGKRRDGHRRTAQRSRPSEELLTAAGPSQPRTVLSGRQDALSSTPSVPHSAQRRNVIAAKREEGSSSSVELVPTKNNEKGKGKLKEGSARQYVVVEIPTRVRASSSMSTTRQVGGSLLPSSGKKRKRHKNASISLSSDDAKSRRMLETEEISPNTAQINNRFDAEMLEEAYRRAEALINENGGVAYPCAVCGKRFAGGAGKKNMRKHMREVHGAKGLERIRGCTRHLNIQDKPTVDAPGKPIMPDLPSTRCAFRREQGLDDSAITEAYILAATQKDEHGIVVCPCLLCGQRFHGRKSRGNMRQHLVNVHGVAKIQLQRGPKGSRSRSVTTPKGNPPTEAKDKDAQVSKDRRASSSSDGHIHTSEDGGGPSDVWVTATPAVQPVSRRKQRRRERLSGSFDEAGSDESGETRLFTEEFLEANDKREKQSRKDRCRLWVTTGGACAGYRNIMLEERLDLGEEGRGGVGEDMPVALGKHKGTESFLNSSADNVDDMHVARATVVLDDDASVQGPYSSSQPHQADSDHERIENDKKADLSVMSQAIGRYAQISQPQSPGAHTFEGPKTLAIQVPERLDVYKDDRLPTESQGLPSLGWSPEPVRDLQHGQASPLFPANACGPSSSSARAIVPCTNNGYPPILPWHDSIEETRIFSIAFANDNGNAQPWPATVLRRDSVPTSLPMPTKASSASTTSTSAGSCAPLPSLAHHQRFEPALMRSTPPSASSAPESKKPRQLSVWDRLWGIS